MNTECSTCLESISSISDISTTPCGHIFHTECIKKWLQNGQNYCPQCKKGTTQNQIIKLYFSGSQSPENDLITELLEANKTLQEEANESKSKQLKLSEEKLELAAQKLNSENETLKIQQENLQLKDENLKLKKRLIEGIAYIKAGLDLLTQV